MDVGSLLLFAQQAAPASHSDSGAMAVVTGLTIFVLAVFIGFEVINKVPPTLHTPLMSGTNAISGITIIGAMLASGHESIASYLGIVAVILAMINVVGGYMVTHRMLKMFHHKEK